MTPSQRDPDLVRQAQWYCRFICRRVDGRCAIEQADRSGVRCPLWGFVNRDKGTLRPPPWMEGDRDG